MVELAGFRCIMLFGSFHSLKIYLAHLITFFLYDIATGALNNFKKTLNMY